MKYRGREFLAESLQQFFFCSEVISLAEIDVGFDVALRALPVLAAARCSRPALVARSACAFSLIAPEWGRRLRARSFQAAHVLGSVKEKPPHKVTRLLQSFILVLKDL